VKLTGAAVRIAHPQCQCGPPSGRFLAFQ